jgi:hypothetical protein
MPASKKSYKIGDQIQWMWLGRPIYGSVREIHFEPVTKTIKEKNIKRNASLENPAYLVQSEAGNLALKLHSELKPAELARSSAARPKMFGSPKKK